MRQDPGFEGDSSLAEGRFEIMAPLGRGAMGTVEKAFDRSLGRAVAIKRLTAGTLESQKRFDREAEVCAQLVHPNVIRIFGTFSHRHEACIVYELVEGGETLGDALLSRPLDTRLDLLEQTAAGVGAAHALNVIHRDLKPANVLVRGGSHALVTDFGLAWIAESSLTRTGQFLGTPSYMAPEQLRSASGSTPAVDVWALGVMLFEALYDFHPFAEHSHSMQELLARIATGRVEVPKGTSSALRDLVLRSLAVEPSKRPHDANEFRLALQAARCAGASAGALPRTLRGARVPLVVLGAATTCVAAAWVGLATPEPPLQEATPPPASTTRADDSLPVADLRALGAALKARDPEAIQREVAGLLREAKRIGNEAGLRDQWLTLATTLQAGDALLPRALPLLDAMAKLTPPAKTNAQETEVANAGLALASVLFGPEPPPAGWASASSPQSLPTYHDVLESLLRAGLRPAAHELGEDLVHAVTTQLAVVAGEPADYWEFVLIAVKLDLRVLDVQFPARRGRGGASFDRPWSAATKDPWKRLVDLRVALGDGKRTDPEDRERHANDLCDLLEELSPKLGPQQWALCTIAAYGALPAEDSLPPLHAAVRATPTHLRLRSALAKHLLRATKWVEARAQAERALELFAERGLKGRLGRAELHRDLRMLRLEALCGANERELARAAHADLPGNSGAQTRLERRYPWLTE